MAHSKQARKRVRQNQIHAERNKGTASRMRTWCKKLMAAVAAGEKAEAEALLPATMQRIDKASKHDVLHRNAADRKKRQVMRAVRAMG